MAQWEDEDLEVLLEARRFLLVPHHLLLDHLLLLRRHPRRRLGLQHSGAMLHLLDRWARRCRFEEWAWKIDANHAMGQAALPRQETTKLEEEVLICACGNLDG